MYPYWHMHHFHAARRPSRLVWFALGAASAALWIKHRRCRDSDQDYGHCIRASVHHRSLPSPPAPPLPPASVPVSDASTPIPGSYVPSQTQWGFGQQAQERQWAEEKERMWSLGRQAGDTMTELSEATLDSVLTTVESLKAKLAEHRIQREKAQKELEERIEREKQEPRRLV